MTRTMLSTALSFTTKLAARAGLSSSSCAPFSLVFPALLNLFFPVPFSFPVFACPCVPVQAINSAYFPKNYVPHIVTAAASLVLIRAFSQGRTTSRDRDLHARTVLVTVRYVFFE